jgi:thiol:disulfide interchange protein DsbC
MFVEESGEYFFPTMVEMKTKRNLGQERVEELSKIDFKSLPLKDAIKTVKGNGKRVMAIFSDPDCPYCKQLESTLVALDNVTIYTFPFPLSIHPGAREKAISIWCSKNPGEQWSKTIISGVAPKSAECSNPIDRNIDLAKKLEIYGTPAMIFVDGSILPGAAGIDVIEDKLNKAK